MQGAGWHIEESEDIEPQVKSFLSKITPAEVVQEKVSSKQVADGSQTMLTQGYEGVLQFIETSK